MNLKNLYLSTKNSVLWLLSLSLVGISILGHPCTSPIFLGLSIHSAFPWLLTDISYVLIYIGLYEDIFISKRSVLMNYILYLSFKNIGPVVRDILL